MIESIGYAAVILALIGGSAALVLYIIAMKFYIAEDPLYVNVLEVLPGTNCGGCGSPGCSAFAYKLVEVDEIDELFCPVGGNETMQLVASILNKEIKEQDPKVAVIHCQGDCNVRPKINEYQGPLSCSFSDLLYGGETACTYGCLGYGDCVDACLFDAMDMNEVLGLPSVIDSNCTGCNACVVACPRDIISLHPKKKRDLKIYVACKNEEKGGIAKRACLVACIACKKCLELCTKDAITINNNLAHIDPDKCTLCRKCVDICPTKSIIEENFPIKKNKKTTRVPNQKIFKKVKSEALC